MRLPVPYHPSAREKHDQRCDRIDADEVQVAVARRPHGDYDTFFKSSRVAVDCTILTMNSRTSSDHSSACVSDKHTPFPRYARLLHQQHKHVVEGQDISGFYTGRLCRLPVCLYRWVDVSRVRLGHKTYLDCAFSDYKNVFGVKLTM